jgi:alpha-1,3-mannosyltransferase
MQVAHVVRQFHPSVGGIEDVVLNIAKYQKKCGDAPQVVTLNRVFRDEAKELPEHDKYQDIPVRRLNYLGSSRYPLCPGVLSVIRDADVVHVHGIDFFFDYLAMTRFWHGKPLVVSTHGGFFHTPYATRLKQFWFSTMTRVSARSYRRVIATSENDGQIFSQVVSSQRLEVIENGVDVEKYAGAASTQPGQNLIYFGRWSANKGLLDTLDLFKQLAGINPAWRLIIAGREFDLRREDLEREIAERGLLGLVELNPAPSQEYLAELLGRSNCFICLSRHEGFGLAAIEAMSAGLMPILSDIPPFAKLVQESGLGLVVNPARLDEAAEAVEQIATVGLAEYRARRASLCQYSKRFAWDQAAERYVRCYQNILGQSVCAA